MANKLYKVSKSKWAGVYAYDSESRKIHGKIDICYYISFKVNGKKKTEKVGWKSEGYSPQVAAEIRSKRVKNARHGKAVKTSKEIRQDQARRDRSLNDIKDAYFESEHGLRIKGRISDLNRYKIHLKPLLGKKRISSLSELDVERLKRTMANHATATYANTLELLRRLANYGFKNNLCPPLPFVIKLPSTNNLVTEYLTPDQAARFMDVLESWPNQGVSRMLKLAMFTGMRRGEIFKLQTNDVDFHQKLIHLKEPKGGKDVSIPMADVVEDLLTEQILWRNDHHPDSHYIFPGRNGKIRTDSSAVNRIKKKAGLPDSFRIFHGLRHHLGVTLANSGEYTLDMIGELLTHKSTAITRRYAQFLPDTKQKAADRAADILLNQAVDHAKRKSGVS